MSGDDFLLVKEDEKREYDVYHKFSEGGIIENVGYFKRLREAIVAAEEYARNQEYPVEYGLRFVF